MILDKLNPAVLIVIGGLLSLFGAYLAQTRQGRNSTAMRQQLDITTDLMRQMAAQTGNKEMLQEVIDVRSKLLAENRASNDDTIKKILAKVPHLTEEYKKLQSSQAQAAVQRLDDFRMKWEPLVRLAVREFDDRMAAVVSAEKGITIKKEDSFKVAGIGQDGGNGQLIRVASLNGVELRLYCSSAQVHASNVSGGSLVVTVRVPTDSENYSNPLSIPLDPQGTPAADLSKTVVSGINKGIEDFLIVAKARA